MAKISISLPDDLLTDLDRCSVNLGFSRSSLITYFMRGSVNQIVECFGDLPLEPPDSTLRRLHPITMDKSLAELHALMVDLGIDAYQVSPHV